MCLKVSGDPFFQWNHFNPNECLDFRLLGGLEQPDVFDHFTLIDWAKFGGLHWLCFPVKIESHRWLVDQRFSGSTAPGKPYLTHPKNWFFSCRWYIMIHPTILIKPIRSLPKGTPNSHWKMRHLPQPCSLRKRCKTSTGQNMCQTCQTLWFYYSY